MSLIKPSETKRAVKYNDFRAKIIPLASDTVSEQYSGDIFDYSDPFKNGFSISVPSETESAPINIRRISHTSDASPGFCSFTVPDPDITFYNNKHKDGFHSTASGLYLPKIGDGIIIWMLTDSNSEDSARAFLRSDVAENNFWIVFKGYVSGISRQIDESGSYYSYECKDMKSRLEDQVIRKTYNGNYKNATTPNSFSDATKDRPYIQEKLTVKEILEDMLMYSKITSFEKSWGFTYFTIDNFDFNGNTELRDFIPPLLVFDNNSVLEAIYRLISSAGSYRMVYNPNNDRIYFVKLSTGAKNCGNEIVLKYGVPKSFAEANSSQYFDVNVMGDSTTRKTNDLANVFKAYSAEIEWYSGHFYIVSGDTQSFRHDGRNFFMPCKNWDGYNYYFGLESVPFGEDHGSSFEIVGCPLYPSWDVRNGYQPYVERTEGFREYIYDSSGSDKPKETKEYATTETEENQGFTVNDRRFVKDKNFYDAVGRNNFDFASGITYEAWMPYGPCPYCNGTGAVEDSGTWNMFGKTRNLDGSVNVSVIAELTSIVPFNFNFIEIDSKYPLFLGGEKEMVPTRHPLPWKNTCPVCRGTGMEPWFKMTTILNNLVDLSPDQTRIGEDSPTVEQTPTDKTWGEVIQDKSYRYPISVQVESFNDYSRCYDSTKMISGDTAIEHPLKGAYQLKNPKYLIFKTADDGSGESFDSSNGNIESLYYTSIRNNVGYSIDAERGLIIFREAQFVACKKPVRRLLVEKTKDAGTVVSYKSVEGDPGVETSAIYFDRGQFNGVGQRTTMFWRPSRAWITCYFQRDRYKTLLGTHIKSGDPINGDYKNNKEFVLRKQIQGEDGFVDYLVGSRIEDNRYCAEIKKKREIGSEQEEFTVRPIVKGSTMDSFKWQVHPWDLGRWNVPASAEDEIDMVVPTDYNKLWDTIYETNIKMGYLFPSGKFHTTEALRENEARSIGYTGAELQNVLRSDTRGKVISWVHKDDRIKLLERGTAELERRNDIQVGGTVKIRGEVPNFNGGFGFVRLIDGVKAVVVKIEMDFDRSFSVSLEVGTEELRVGQLRESEQDYNRRREMEIYDLNIRRSDSLITSMSESEKGNGRTINFSGTMRMENG